MTTKLLGVVLVVIFFAWIGIAQAQEYQDVSIQVNGKSVVLNVGNPTFLEVEPQSIITGSIHLASSPETPICTLEDCTTNIKTDSVLGGWDVVFTAVMGNDTNAEKIQVLNEQNIPTYTIIFQNPPSQKKSDTTQIQSWIPTWISSNIGYMVGSAILIAVIVCVVVAMYHARKSNGRWRLN